MISTNILFGEHAGAKIIEGHQGLFNGLDTLLFLKIRLDHKDPFLKIYLETEHYTITVLSYLYKE